MTRRCNDQYILAIAIGGSPVSRCRAKCHEIALVTTSGLLDLLSYVDL